MANPTRAQDQAHAGIEDPQDERGASTARVQRELQRTREDTEAVVEDLRKLREELSSLLRDRLENHPYLTLGATAGIGYVLGGGLPKGSPALALGLATRMAASWLIREVGGSALAQAGHTTGETGNATGEEQ